MIIPVSLKPVSHRKPIGGFNWGVPRGIHRGRQTVPLRRVNTPHSVPSRGARAASGSQAGIRDGFLVSRGSWINPNLLFPVAAFTTQNAALSDAHSPLQPRLLRQRMTRAHRRRPFPHTTPLLSLVSWFSPATLMTFLVTRGLTGTFCCPCLLSPFSR